MPDKDDSWMDDPHYLQECEEIARNEEVGEQLRIAHQKAMFLEEHAPLTERLLRIEAKVDRLITMLECGGFRGG